MPRKARANQAGSQRANSLHPEWQEERRFGGPRFVATRAETAPSELAGMSDCVPSESLPETEKEVKRYLQECEARNEVLMLSNREIAIRVAGEDVSRRKWRVIGCTCGVKEMQATGILPPPG